MTRHEIQLLRETRVPGARVARPAEVSERSNQPGSPATASGQDDATEMRADLLGRLDALLAP